MNGLELPPDIRKYEVVLDFEEISELLLPKFSGSYRFVVVDADELDLAVGKRSDNYESIIKNYLIMRNISRDYKDLGRGILELNYNSNFIVFMKDRGFYPPKIKTLENLMIGVNFRCEINFK